MEEVQETGPRVGLGLTLEQATLILQRHRVGSSCSRLHNIDRGYNNRSVLVVNEDNIEFVVRLGGRFWTWMKTENEVATITILSRTHPTLPLPQILGFYSSREKSGIGQEYILMRKLSGVPLDTLFSGLDFASQKIVVDGVVEILGQLKSCEFKEIGSFRFENGMGDTFGIELDEEDLKEAEIVIGEGLEAQAGPFFTYLEYFRAHATRNLGYLKDCPFVMEGMKDIVDRIGNFITKMTDPETTKLREDVIVVKFIFTHGDFEPRNILVDPVSLRITGILDFEFSGSFPEDEEWFAGFEDFEGSNTSEEDVFSDIRGNDQDSKSDDGTEAKLRLKSYFLNKCVQKNISTPDRIKGHKIRAMLYYFKENICPWWMREEVIPIPGECYGQRDRARKIILKVLEMFEF